MKTNLLQKTTLLLFALLAMGGSNVWANNVTLSTSAATELPLVAASDGVVGYSAISGMSIKDGHTDSGSNNSSITYIVNNPSEQDLVFSFAYGTANTSGTVATLTLTKDATTITRSIDLIRTDANSWNPKSTKQLVVNDLAAGEWTLTYSFTTTKSYTANCNAFMVTPVSTLSTVESVPNTFTKTNAVTNTKIDDVNADFGDINQGENISFVVNNTSAQAYLFHFLASCNDTDVASGKTGEALVTITDAEGKVTKKTFEIQKDGTWSPKTSYRMFVEDMAVGYATVDIAFNAVKTYACNMSSIALSTFNSISLPCASGSFDLTKYFAKDTRSDKWKTNDGDYAGGSLGYTSQDDVITYIVKVTEAGTYSFGFNGGNESTTADATTLTFSLKDDADAEYMNEGSVWVKPISDPSKWGNVSFDGCTTAALAPGYYLFTITWTTGATNLRLLHFDGATVKYTIPSSGLGTYCSAQKLDFTGLDAAAYIITSNPDGSTIMATKVDGVVPANTGIIVKGEGGAEINIAVSTGTLADVAGNKLVGVTEATEIIYNSANSYYIMNGGEFKPVKKDGTISANRAYLFLEGVSSASARSLSIDFSDGETTGISEMERMRNGENEKFFDLQGRRVAQPTKGLYIVNGRKVVIK